MSQLIRESIKTAIATRFAPAIDFNAPYAKVMLRLIVDDIVNVLQDDDEALMNFINRK